MNGIKLFRIFGINVSIHWSWFFIAAYEIQSRRDRYGSLAWNIAEYLLLFAIVLLHEFGHALACRSVGGQANSIMLWPLGGVAFVSPPPRPGAVLWSIAAGPLVNVALLAISFPLFLMHLNGNVGKLIDSFMWLNAGLLIFNILPIYPLDGGQILQSLLWFVMGRGKSMAVATVIGMIGAVGLGCLALYMQNIYAGVMALFVASQCWSGWRIGAQIRELENAVDRPGFACPACGRPPVIGKFWRCANCSTTFDTFQTNATCPTCGENYDSTECGGCRNRSPIAAWRRMIQPAPAIPVTPLILPAQPAANQTGWM